MLIAIEQGNTNTLFAIHDGSDWKAQWRTATNASRTADEYAVWIFQLMQMAGYAASDVSGCIVSTVVPQARFHLRNLARRYFEVEPLIVGDAHVDLGVEARIERPEEAGEDRVVNALGAYVKYGGPLLVVDSGTATTIDVVGSDGAFEGGVIAPGINLSLQALHEAAAKLPRIAIERPPQVIGKNTVHSMQAGVFWGYISLIDGLIDRMKAEYPSPVRVIATGGVASLFQGASSRIDVFDPELTLRGLYEIWRRSGGKCTA